MNYQKMAFRIRRWLRKQVSKPNDPYIKIDLNGVAHFDVAAYLASPEGRRRLEKFSSRCAS